MKNLITLAIVLIAILSCLRSNEEGEKQANLKLDGFWALSFSQYADERTSQRLNCPVTDARIEDVWTPYALGSHLLIKGDSVSLFRYPYVCHGTFKYEVARDSLFVKTNYTSTDKFSLQKSKENILVLNFEEKLTSTCRLPVRARYERFSPDLRTINKLLRDSISCDALIGKWWYLRKEISFEDGAESIVLNYPKGMPDSIRISKEIINKDAHRPFIRLKLDNRIVKLLIKNPSENSYTLIPEFKNDKILFSYFLNYEEYGGIDTIYYDVIYQKNNK